MSTEIFKMSTLFSPYRNDFVIHFPPLCAIISLLPSGTHGGVKVSTGVWKLGKRAEVGQVFVKNDPFKRNAKRTNNFALAA